MDSNGSVALTCSFEDQAGLIRQNLYDSGEKREQLFDPDEDPGEMNNLAYDQKYKKQLAQHRDLPAKWAKETDDLDFAYYIP